jgi:hypothetical protein
MESKPETEKEPAEPVEQTAIEPPTQTDEE